MHKIKSQILSAQFLIQASIDAKLEREKRLVDATDRAREARANDKVIKGELPTMERY